LGPRQRDAPISWGHKLGQKNSIGRRPSLIRATDLRRVGRMSSQCLILAALSACDPMFRLEVTAPVAHAAQRSCLQTTIAELGPRAPIIRQWGSRDGTAVLVAMTRGRTLRYSGTEADSIARILLRVRDTCGAAGVQGAPPYRVKQTPF